MTNFTPDQVFNAYEALGRLERAAWENSKHNKYEGMNHAQVMNAIYAVFPPKPQNTMASIQWNDNEHYLAEAHTVDGPGIMVSHLDCPEEGKTYIDCLIKNPGADPIMRTYLASQLTPTGRRYTPNEM